VAMTSRRVPEQLCATHFRKGKSPSTDGLRYPLGRYPARVSNTNAESEVTTQRARGMPPHPALRATLSPRERAGVRGAMRTSRPAVCHIASRVCISFDFAVSNFQFLVSITCRPACGGG
jgi:hypothetical protein